MGKVIMAIGMPGSGKTTALKPFANKNNYIYISPDDIRKELTGDAFDQSKNKEVWDLVYERTKQALAKGSSVVVDALFAKDFERKNFINFARENGAEKVQGVFATTPYEVALDRNNNRDRVVPEYAMERIRNNLKHKNPVIEDGFDSVFDIDENQDLVRVEMKGKEEIIKEFKPKIK